MNNAWAIIELIEAGRYKIAFPDIKPSEAWPVQCFSLDYSQRMTWTAYWEMKGIRGLLFSICTPCIQIRNIEIELTKAEKKALAKALKAAHYNERAKWTARREAAKYDTI
jgi:hypothetical protein